MRRIISCVLAMVMLLAMIPTPILASDTTTSEASDEIPVISVDNTYGKPGGTVDVYVDLMNNPGITSAKLSITFDEQLTLISAENGDVFSALSYMPPNQLESGATISSSCQFAWFAADISDENIQNGVILKLTFQVSEDAEVGKYYNIVVSGDDVVDKNLNEFTLAAESQVAVIDYTPGDVNDDGSTTMLDVVLLCRYIVDGCKYDPNGYAVTVNERASNVNDDGKMSMLDVVLLCRYIVDGCTYDPNGYAIKLVPESPKCSHVMEAIAYKAATCTEDGNLSYYHCTVCGKYYNSSNGTTEISLASTVLAAKGHTAVTDPYVAPEPGVEGWTEGSHCSVCGEVLVAQERIDPLPEDEYTILYKLPSTDTYLAALNNEGKIENSNPDTYTTQKGVDLLNDLDVAGYDFYGWYTEPSGGGTRVSKIAVGTTGTVVLYAYMKAHVYKITYDSPDITVTGTKVTGETVEGYTEYTVDTGATLKNPELYNYTFIGWSNDDGFLVSRVLPGTTGNMTLHANWTSNRNRAISYESYGEPIIIEDDVNGQFLFVYNIGKIDNVPLNEVAYLGNPQKLNYSEEHDVTDTVSETYAEKISEMVSNATTNSSGWTLSKEWSDIYSTQEEVGSLSEKTDERTTSEGKVVGGEYFVSNSNAGSTYVSAESGGSAANSAKITTEDSFGINTSYDESTEKYCDAQLGISNTTEVSAGVSLPVDVVKVSAGVKNTTTVEAGVQSGRKDNTAYHIDSSKSSYIGTVNTNNTSSYYNAAMSNTSSWNSESGYTQSYETAINDQITEAIKSQLSQTTTHSISKALSDTNTETKEIERTELRENEYSTSLTYNKGTSTTVKKTFNYEVDAAGHYRIITAGTVHVYGVVGYDVATSSYYTYCFNVLDDTTREILDYSKDNMNFDDCENGVVTFKVPYEVNEYVTGFVGQTDGLEINYDGVVTGFTPGKDYDGTIVIPQYVSKDNLNGEYTAVKVTSFEAGAFDAVRDSLTTVVLPLYITDIPANAFEGCSKLKTVIAYGVTSIGDYAFKGCTSLETFYVDNKVTSLGKDAFEDVPEVAVTAYDSKVAEAAINCKAQRITVNIAYINDSFNDRTVDVPDTAVYFALIGNGGTYYNVQIDSKAGETMINNMKFANNSDTPLKLSSDNITLARVTVEDAPGFAMILSKDAEVKLLGDVILNSSGENTVLSKNVVLSKADQSTTSKVITNGKFLVCGTVTNTQYLNVAPTVITEDEYEQYLNSFAVTLEPNGGEFAENTETQKLVFYGQTYGALPTPVRTGYTFEGWYTELEGGEQVTSETVVKAFASQTLYARWSAMAYTVSWTDGTGYAIEVSRAASPYANAEVGNLINEAVIYYGDELEVTYTKADYYHITAHGETEITVNGDVTASEIYASAELNEVSDWVLATEMPSEAQIIDQKWTYDQTQYTTSESSSLSGWTLYDSSYVWSDWSAWSSWSSTSASASDSRQVESRTGYHYYYYVCSSCGAHMHGYGTCYSWAGGCGKATVPHESYTKFMDALSYSSTKDFHGTGVNYSDNTEMGRAFAYTSSSSSYYVAPEAQYRYRTRSQIWTYYFERIDSLESESYPEGDNISNITEWVQYRAK